MGEGRRGAGHSPDNPYSIAPDFFSLGVYTEPQAPSESQSPAPEEGRPTVEVIREEEAEEVPNTEPTQVVIHMPLSIYLTIEPVDVK